MKKVFLKTLNTFKTSLPIMFGVLLLVGLLNTLFQDNYSRIFTGNYFFDPLIGTIVGSVSFGIPLTSYVVGGELLENGISLVAVTAFVMAWTTVGIAMLPLEAKFLGKKFAIVRNVINFLFSIIIAMLVVSIINFFN